MSWHFLQGQEVDYWDPTSSDGIPPALSRLIPTAATCCSRDSEMGACPGSQSGTTCVHSEGGPGADGSTSSAEGFHAKTSARRVRIEDLPESIRVLSTKCSALLRKYGLALSSRKTVRTFVPGDSVRSSRDLPAWGMWDELGYWELGTSVQTIDERECGSLLPTPTICGDWNRKGASARSGDGLATVLSRLPTPTAKLYGNNRGGSAGRTGKVRPSLESLTGGVFPALREWMLGWPIGWTASRPLAMDRWREWLHSHGLC